MDIRICGFFRDLFDVVTKGNVSGKDVDPRRGNILRRETIFDSTFVVMFNLLGFRHMVILVWHLLTTLTRTKPTRQLGTGSEPPRNSG